LDNVWDKGLLTGLWISDAEGVLHTTDVSVVFTRGLPVQVVAILVLKSVEVRTALLAPLAPDESTTETHPGQLLRPEITIALRQRVTDAKCACGEDG